MPVTADLTKLVDKAYQDKTLAELVDAPVSALAGVSDGDAKAPSRTPSTSPPSATSAATRTSTRPAPSSL